MRIHMIQTGTCAIKPAQLESQGKGIQRQLNVLRDTRWSEPIPIYAWVIEHPEGVIVIDTGETARALQPGHFPAWHPFFKRSVKIWVRPEEEIGPQLKQLDISPRDVRWLVLTHLHTDHAGGLYHFPGVETVVTRKEYQAARSFTGQLAGYLPQHWPDWFKPRLIDFSPEPFANFPRHMKLTSAGDVLLIPTPGHTSGHMSVLLLEGEQTICFAGDVSYSQDLFVRGKVDGISFNEGVARRTIEQLQTYTKNTPTVYLPSHDPASAERLAKREPIVYAESVLTGN